MRTKVIIAHYYIEGSAGSNRILCFAKGYRDLGLEVVLMLFAPSRVQAPRIEGVSIRLFSEPAIPFRLLRRLAAVCRYVREIKREYIKGESVIHIYRTPWWGFLFSKNKYRFFFERGEVPFFSDSKSLSYRLQEHIGLRVTKRACGLLAQTYALKDYYSRYGVENIEVINMFVDTGRFENLPPSDGTDYIAYCGTLSCQKDGVDDLIRAFGILHGKYKGCKLYLIGGFEPLYGDEQYLRKLVSDSGLDDDVVFTGRVSPDAIPGLLANAKVLLMARPDNPQTRYGFPTKLGEYLCTGRPVVLTPVGEVCRYLTDRENCFFARTGDYRILAETIDSVLSDYDNALRVGGNGRLLVDKDFSISSQVQKAWDFMQK